MLNKHDTLKTMQQPRYARTLWGVCLGLLLTWLSACMDNDPETGPTPNPETQEGDPSPAGTGQPTGTPTPNPGPQEQDDSGREQEKDSSTVALTGELIEALGAGMNLNNKGANDLTTLKKALRAIQAGERNINDPIAFSMMGLQKRHVLEAVLMFQTDTKLLQALIKQGANVNYKHGKETLLTCAAKNLSYQAIKWLLANGADVPAADEKKKLVSNIFSNGRLEPSEKEELRETLVQKGATEEQKRSKGTTNDSKQG